MILSNSSKGSIGLVVCFPHHIRCAFDMRDLLRLPRTWVRLKRFLVDNDKSKVIYMNHRIRQTLNNIRNASRRGHHSLGTLFFPPIYRLTWLYVCVQLCHSSKTKLNSVQRCKKAKTETQTKKRWFSASIGDGLIKMVFGIETSPVHVCRKCVR